MEFHEFANIFPMLGDDEAESLRADIQANGLNQPVTIFEGKVLDGRNRWLACLKLGIEPKQREFDGDREAASS